MDLQEEQPKSGEQKEEKKQDEPPRKRNRRKRPYLWLLCLTFLAAVIAFGIGIASDAFISNSVVVCVVIILVLILIAFLGDIVAMAMVTADLDHFNAMASRKVRGAKMCVRLVKKGDRVASIFSDVLGDVTAIVSGSVGASLAFVLLEGSSVSSIEKTLIVASVGAAISGVAVLAKAIAKIIGIKNSTKVVFVVGRFLSIFKKE